MGTGRTVLSRTALNVVESSNDDSFKSMGRVDYANPITGDREVLDFNDLLWVWNPPHHGDPKSDDIMEREPHHYVIGCMPPGQLVTTETGLRTIESVKIGDKLLSNNGFSI